MWKRWLLHATDFQSLMYPCFIIGRILGVFPYKINASTFEVSKLHYILSTVIVCVCSIYNIMLIHSFIYKVNLGDTTKTLQVIIYFMCSGFITIIIHILSGPRMRLLQTILKISSKLPSNSFQKLSRFIYVKDILGTIYVIVQMYMYFPKTETFHVVSGLARALTAYYILVVHQTNMLYINCVYVLKTCFKNINDNLTHVQRLMVNDTRPSCVPMLIGQIKRTLLIELKALEKRHLMLSNIVQMMNIVFNYVTLMMLLVWICETGKNQAQQIRTTIHDLLNNTSDKQIKNELKLFSLQLLHCDNTFSAKGLNIDATLFAAMLFQMDMMYVNCVCILKACFKEINNNLRHMQKFIVNNEQRVRTVSYYYERKNLFLIIKLKALKKQHMMISNTVQILNTIFSVPVLITIVTTLIEMSLELYLHIIEWHDGLVFNLNGQLQLFSLQLLHCRNSFSTKGFHIDATFLATVSCQSLTLINEMYLVYFCHLTF
ncbi:hypothetical protein ALC62_05443 [Cyphomyrmex costatus]|uniref:Gustatory receptor n=1 Tax=Cyphomyrmex costatus TaxID=456900 RepID=A0A195CTA3_9HYME|nr:hypothetical protein ALC62_05443 [Cyphomyrmex costatus]